MDSCDAAVPCSTKPAYDTSRITNHQTIGRDVLRHNATRADNGIAPDSNPWKDCHARGDPHVILDNSFRRWRRQLALLHTMLVPINDEHVMTQQTVVADRDLFVC